MEKKRIEWLSIMKGFAILMVVMYHVQLIDMSTGMNHLFCQIVKRSFDPIMMPLFFFASGGLLYLTRIQKKWITRDLYVDKFYRLMIPFVFFVTFFYLLKVVLTPIVKTKVVLSIGSFMESFFVYPGHPSAHLWFLAVLMWFMLMYPIFKWLCDHQGWLLTFLLFTMGIFFYDFSQLIPFNYFNVVHLNNYLVFFVFGIVFFKLEAGKYFREWWTALLLSILYVILFIYDVPLLTSIMGILAMTNICQILFRWLPNIFSSFRDYTYQIYLMSLIFQPFVELVLWKRFFYNENLFLVFYLLNVLSGIFLPVVVTKVIESSNFRFLKMCIGLKP